MVFLACRCLNKEVQNVDHAHYANRNILDTTILKFGNHKTQIRYMSLLGIQDYDTRHICICRACHHDFKKPNYIPRFMKFSNERSIAQEKCTVTGCSNQADFKSADSINFEDIPGGMELGLPNNPTTPSLCANHYYKVYKHQHKKQMNCTTCSAKPKPLEKFNRHCPNPTVVEKYLHATQGFSEKILDDDLVCLKCYKQQHELLETLVLSNYTRN